MADTYVARLDPAAGRRLKDDLGREQYAFRPQDHAWWSARGPDTVVTLYRSGKLVVQGQGAEAFVTRYLDQGAERKGGEGAAPSGRVLRHAEIGSDESGKGDYFGPLTVAAALVDPSTEAELRALGVQDSKAVSDGLVRRVEGAITDLVPHAVRVLEPEAYNEAYAAVGNLNRLLGRLHAEVIEAVVAQAPEGPLRIVVDRFGDPEHVRRNLSPEVKRHAFVMPTKAESHPAVATASFLARAAFLRGFEELKGLAGGELYRGASDPRILPLARRLYREGGEPWLGRFAKLHFKTTARARVP
jgi:ribonuclease HIII